MKTAVITGASRRLGLYLAESLLADGYHVIAITRSASEALRSLGGDALDIHEVGEYGDEAALAKVVERIRGSERKIDVMIHNASMFVKDPHDEAEYLATYQQMIDVHMKLPAYLNHGLRSLLDDESAPGCIINITDIFVDNPSEEHALYCSTKAALDNAGKAFAKRLAPGIRVNNVRPGPIMFLPDHGEGEKAKVMSETLLAAEPGFLPILQGIRFIIDNRFVTGSAVTIDGGRAIR